MIKPTISLISYIFPTLILDFTSLQFLLPLLSSLSRSQALVINLPMVQLASSLLRRRPTLQPAMRVRRLPLLRKKPSPPFSTSSMMLRPTPFMSKSVKSHPDQTYSWNILFPLLFFYYSSQSNLTQSNELSTG